MLTYLQPVIWGLKEDKKAESNKEKERKRAGSDERKERERRRKRAGSPRRMKTFNTYNRSNAGVLRELSRHARSRRSETIRVRQAAERSAVLEPRDVCRLTTALGQEADG